MFPLLVQMILIPSNRMHFVIILKLDQNIICDNDIIGIFVYLTLYKITVIIEGIDKVSCIIFSNFSSFFKGFSKKKISSSKLKQVPN